MSEFQSYIGIKLIEAKPADERAVDYAALKKSIDALKRLGVVDKEKYGKINLTRYLYCNASTTASAVWVPLPTQEMRRALALMVAHPTAAKYVYQADEERDTVPVLADMLKVYEHNRAQFLQYYNYLERTTTVVNAERMMVRAVWLSLLRPHRRIDLSQWSHPSVIKWVTEVFKFRNGIVVNDELTDEEYTRYLWDVMEDCPAVRKVVLDTLKQRQNMGKNPDWRAMAGEEMVRTSIAHKFIASTIRRHSDTWPSDDVERVCAAVWDYMLYGILVALTTKPKEEGPCKLAAPGAAGPLARQNHPA